ncbi:MAG: ribosome maturation factor RimM [Microscillaceae bacterium]|jgi:16S rRNA processing protein RimM|nr:ribosome maturation factor RimM [Microscillaceae bacterium]
MQQDECYELGSIVKTHGLKGEVLCYLDVDVPDEYAEMDSVFVEIKKKLEPFFIEKIQLTGGNKAIIKFEDLNDITAVEKIVHCKLYLPLDVLPESEDDDFYLHEILNYTVIDVQKGTLGIVTNLYEGAQQDLLGMTYQNREVLIPLVDAIVLQVNHENRTIEVNLPEGLVELYMDDRADQDRDE